MFVVGVNVMTKLLFIRDSDVITVVLLHEKIILLLKFLTRFLLVFLLYKTDKPTRYIWVKFVK